MVIIGRIEQEIKRLPSFNIDILAELHGVARILSRYGFRTTLFIIF